MSGRRHTLNTKKSLNTNRTKVVRGSGQTTPYNRAHHWFAVFTASATFLLIIAGALVTSNDAGLSVPDWPTSFGHLFKIPPMVGGVRFEHGHRMFAEFIGVLTIAIAVWTWKTDHRSWMKKLGIAALGTIIMQGILGGITVLEFLPPAVSTAHAIVGQTFFCIAVAIALFTGQQFVNGEPITAVEQRQPSLLTLSTLSIGILYVQLFLGGMYRHNGMGWEPHVINAGVVTVILVWTAIRALSRFSEIREIRRAAIIVFVLLIVQISLGFFAFLEKVILGKNVVQPGPAMVISTVAHTATGALLLASVVILAIQTWRHVPARSAKAVPGGTRKAVTA